MPLVLTLGGLAFAEHALSEAAVRTYDEQLARSWFATLAAPSEPHGYLLRWIAAGLMATVLGLGAPLVEELVFRGLLPDVLAPRFGRTAAWLVSATVFGLLHAPLVANAILFALVLTVVRHATGSLALPIAMHMANNALPAAASAWELARHGQASAWDGPFPGGALTGLVLLALCLPLPLRYLRRHWPRRAAGLTAP